MSDIDLSRDACDERLRAALMRITEHPEHWDQMLWVSAVYDSSAEEELTAGRWPCGTTACLAGTAAIQAGLVRVSAGGGVMLSDAGQEVIRQGFPHGANVESFRLLGQLLFGLTNGQAQHLFHDVPRLADLWHQAALMTGGRVCLPEELDVLVAAIDDPDYLPEELDEAVATIDDRSGWHRDE